MIFSRYRSSEQQTTEPLLFGWAPPKRHIPPIFQTSTSNLLNIQLSQAIVSTKTKTHNFLKQFTHQTHVAATPPTHGIQTYAPGNPKDDGRQEGTSYRIKGTMYKNTTSPEKNVDVLRCGDALGTCVQSGPF